MLQPAAPNGSTSTVAAGASRRSEAPVLKNAGSEAGEAQILVAGSGNVNAIARAASAQAAFRALPSFAASQAAAVTAAKSATNTVKRIGRTVFAIGSVAVTRQGAGSVTWPPMWMRDPNDS